MKYLSLILLACMAVSCDCLQVVQGTVTNEKGKPLQGVAVCKTGNGPDKTETDSLGHFMLRSVSGGLRCPPMKVTAKKSGYATIEVSIPSGGTETIILKTE